MFLLVALLIAITVFAVRGGNIGGIADLGLRAPLLVISAALVIKMTYASGLYHQRPGIGATIWLCGMFAGVAFIWINRRRRALLVAAAGALCNIAVIIANGGKMPTGPWAYEIFERMPVWYRMPGISDPKYAEPFVTEGTPLWFLADVLPPILPFSFPFSIGDVLIGIGIITLVGQAMLGKVDGPDEAATWVELPELGPSASGCNLPRLASAAAPPRRIAAPPSLATIAVCLPHSLLLPGTAGTTTKASPVRPQARPVLPGEAQRPPRSAEMAIPAPVAPPADTSEVEPAAPVTPVRIAHRADTSSTAPSTAVDHDQLDAELIASARRSLHARADRFREVAAEVRCNSAQPLGEEPTAWQVAA